MRDDADRFSELPRAMSARAPGLWLAEAALRRLLDQIAVGHLTIVTPDGRRLSSRGGRPGPEATLVLHRWRALRRLATGGDVAFSEAYVDGDWSSPNLPAVIELAAHNLPDISARAAAWGPARLVNRVRHLLRRNSKAGSRRNISFHYDLGNAFYRLWLDDGMNYSSAIEIAPGQSLEEAQAARLDRIAEMLEILPGHKVLEIGCGWGALAATMARRGANVTGITLSREQLAYARESHAADPALAGRTDFHLVDYRDVGGRYDRIVSIEMMEAVGEAYWPVYFAKLRECLAPGGTAVLQVITIAEDRFETYRRNTDFIQRHIFPGGMLPTKTHIAGHARAAGLEPVESLCFGNGYAQTLAEWRSRYMAARSRTEPLGFGPAFHRLWEYYLGYCEGGFRAGAIDVGLYKFRG
ncbi:cyclopropane-fatty-acyl-phospholipid synthase [Pseudoxanthobacter soli DSM 19599]|uniref:Cyclopropane-fatty-acyl-phospholipid synthase n=1 Tax=Pseudoxanthobacter soli DSM 19599 TaxID=1123029 RepID=A0A1M7ZPI1_9HYPH|nr:cyclopropane-fatty-acyl-phospholipid synthase family protein [Pseudoxanthobacter soli]SHO66771.1 cyclopropane-fatty-acyl-phospholipid synthase [Pseudoxanthobacter soli DSM 19599]